MLDLKKEIAAMPMVREVTSKACIDAEHGCVIHLDIYCNDHRWFTGNYFHRYDVSETEKAKASLLEKIKSMFSKEYPEC